MIQEWKPDLLTKLYVYSLCLLVYAVAEVSWLIAVPRLPLYLVVMAFSIIKIIKNGITFNFKKFIWILVWFVFIMVIIISHNAYTAMLLHRISYFFIFSTIILLSLEEMKYLLNALTVCFVVILVISIPAWILYLLGVPLPHTGPYYHSDNFHIYYDYYLFTADAGSLSNDYNRFSSIFLEPGQMATPCMFLFHINTREGKFFRFKNIVMLVGVVMSFSLIAYGLLIVSLIVNQMNRVRFRIPLVIMTIFFLVGISIYFINHEENAINALIISRLEYDETEGNISGYNRTSEDFDLRYDQMMNTSNKYFGIHDERVNWTTNASGYKNYIVHNGIVGFSLLMLLMLILLWDNFNRASLVFIIMVVVAFLVRDLLITPLWLTPTIIGMYILGRRTQTSVYSDIPD